MLTGCFSPVIFISPLGKIVVVSVPSTAVTKREDSVGIDHVMVAVVTFVVLDVNNNPTTETVMPREYKNKSTSCHAANFVPPYGPRAAPGPMVAAGDHTIGGGLIFKQLGLMLAKC